MDKAIDDVVEMRNKLIKILECEIDGEPELLNTSEIGLVVDIIKDLYAAEKYYYEACHSKSTYERDFPSTNNANSPYGM